MSCGCGAQRIEDCASLGVAGDELGSDAGDKVHRALWCLLHPLQCRRDPKTGKPIPALGDVLLLGALVGAWWYLTRD